MNGHAMATNGHAMAPAYQDRLEAFRNSDEDRNMLVSEILRNFDELKLKYEETLDVYNNEVASRRMWQGKAASCEQSLAHLKQASGSNNFVVALIDGDGAVFQDNLLSMGKEGGAEAAHQLHTEIKKHLNQIYPESNVSDWSIVVQVILNQHGLASKLCSLGIISETSDLYAFGRTFGLAQPLFSFVDVGTGKERADHKIRESLRLYLPNSQCRHVFFAPCHDNGYLPVLEPYRRDSSVASRLTLVETRPAEPGFVELGLQRIRLPRIFRTYNLPARAPQMFSAPSPPALVASPAPLAPSARTPSANFYATSTTFTPAAPKAPKAASPAPSIESAASSLTNMSSWAQVGGKGSAGKTINIAPARKAPRKHIVVNTYDERVDPALPKTDASAESRFMERMKTMGKCCNSYHLTGKCEAGSYCDYYHGEKLSPGELLVLKHKATSRSCPMRTECRDADCTYGHTCARWTARTCTMGENCYFADTHHMDMTPAKRLFEDGSTEWIAAYLDKARQK